MNHCDKNNCMEDSNDISQMKWYLRIIYRIRHAHPAIWLAAIAVTLTLFAIFVPLVYILLPV